MTDLPSPAMIRDEPLPEWEYPCTGVIRVRARTREEADALIAERIGAQLSHNRVYLLSDTSAADRNAIAISDFVASPRPKP